MAIITGTIEPLKRIRSELRSNGITQFDSIGKIRSFKADYKHQIANVAVIAKAEIDKEIEELKSTCSLLSSNIDRISTQTGEKIDNELVTQKAKADKITTKSKKSRFHKINYWLDLKIRNYLIARKTKKRQLLIERKIRPVHKQLFVTERRLNSMVENIDDAVVERVQIKTEELQHIRQIIDDLYPVIAGAIGETAVVAELKKLPDSYYVVNDFSIKLDPPIYRKKQKDRVYSVQIDHLVVCRAGIFILETKNWSRESVKDYDLRSPVEQVLRTSYAMFVLLNAKSSKTNLSLTHHHWGEKKIPIRNVIVMTNARPKEEFKHVKLLTLDRLNNYIGFFDPVLSKDDVTQIFHCLRDQRDQRGQSR